MLGSNLLWESYRLKFGISECRRNGCPSFYRPNSSTVRRVTRNSVFSTFIKVYGHKHTPQRCRKGRSRQFFWESLHGRRQKVCIPRNPGRLPRTRTVVAWEELSIENKGFSTALTRCWGSTIGFGHESAASDP